MALKTLILLACASAALLAQPATVTVADTMYGGIGGPTYCSGTFTLTWSTFYSEDGYLIQGGTSAPIAVNSSGSFSVAVVPTNVTHTPATGIYLVRYNLPPVCAPATEYWNVPTASGTYTLNMVRALPVPPPSLIPVGSLAPPITSGIYALCFQGGAVQWGTLCGAGTGTVVSVGLSLPNIFTVTHSPVTSSGTLTGTLATQSANQVWAGPTSGAAAAPTFRSLVGADLPNPSSSTLGGVESLAAVSHKWINTISTAGVPAATQPAFSDLSGSATCSQLPALTGDTTTSAGSCATTTVALNGGSVPASAAVLGTNSMSQPIAAAAADIISLWASCSGTDYLGADGNCHSAGGSGTVASVALSLPSSILTVSGSPVTTTGTLTGTLATQTANYVWAGPTSGSASAPTFRALVGADLPVPSSSTLGGVESLAAVSHKWIKTISTAGVPAATQPAFSDVSGSATCGQLPALTGDTTTSAGSCATTTAKINGTSVPASAAVLGTNSSSQPVAANQSAVSSVGYAAGGGTANAQTVTLSPVITAYAAGLSVSWLPTAANTTTTPTLNVNSVAAKTIVKVGGAALAASDLTTTAIATAVYDGTYFELQNPQTIAASSSNPFIQTLTAPIHSNFSQQNFSPASHNVSTEIDNSTPVTSVTIQQTQGSGVTPVNACLMKAVLASESFTITVALSGNLVSTNSGPSFGIALSDGTTFGSNYIFFQMTGKGGSTPPSLEIDQSSDAVYDSNTQPISVSLNQVGPLLWLRIVEDSVHRTYFTSADGITFNVFYQEAVTTHLTTAYYGYSLFGNSGTPGAQLSVTDYSFTETNP